MTAAANSAPIASTLAALHHLIEVVAQLRSPTNGCPWDLAQTQESLLPYAIEEAYEVSTAIRSGDQEAIAEELGDLLLQVVLQAQVAQDEGKFDLSVVVQKITDKLIRRHPHVFAGLEVQNLAEIQQNWEQIKAAEKGDDLATTQQLSYQLKRFDRSLPPLTASLKISQKAAKAGFEWETVEGVWDKFHEELGEFQQAIAQESKAAQASELGDLLFTVVNLARWHDLDPDAALAGTNQRFIQRLMYMESVSDRPLADYTPLELETLWQTAKVKLAVG